MYGSYRRDGVLGEHCSTRVELGDFGFDLGIKRDADTDHQKQGRDHTHNDERELPLHREGNDEGGEEQSATSVSQESSVARRMTLRYALDQSRQLLPDTLGDSIPIGRYLRRRRAIRLLVEVPYFLPQRCFKKSSPECSCGSRRCNVDQDARTVGQEKSAEEEVDEIKHEVVDLTLEVVRW